MNLKIPQATSKGYIEVKPYGAFDWSYPDSLTRRGRVQGDHGDIAPTIMCQNEIYVYEGIEDGQGDAITTGEVAKRASQSMSYTQRHLDGSHCQSAKWFNNDISNRNKYGRPERNRTALGVEGQKV